MMDDESKRIEDLDAKALADQLRRPHGDISHEIAKSMNQINQTICTNAYRLLHAKQGDQVMELGMCNGFFINVLIDTAEHLRYTGVDYSEDMIQEASKVNDDLIKSGQVKFIHASIDSLPFADNSFDKVISINTIYFWPELKKNLLELKRVLKPNGQLLLAYRSKEYLDQTDIADHGFNKYHPDEIIELLEHSGFNKVITQVIKEEKKEFRGKEYEKLGFYTIAHKHD